MISEMQSREDRIDVPERLPLTTTGELSIHFCIRCQLFHIQTKYFSISIVYTFP